MKMRMKMINRSHRYDIHRTRPRRGYKCTKYKMCLSMMMVRCNKQHLSNIWRWIHKKKPTTMNKQTKKKHWGWVEKKCCL